MKHKDDGRGHVFNSFIRDCCSELKRENSVVVFFDYQYMELQKIYKNKLDIKYDEVNEWWVCKLITNKKVEPIIEKKEVIKEKKPRKKRHYECVYDIPLKECYELRQSGYTYQQLANKYGCGVNTILKRLDKYKEELLKK